MQIYSQYVGIYCPTLYIFYHVTNIKYVSYRLREINKWFWHVIPHIIVCVVPHIKPCTVLCYALFNTLFHRLCWMLSLLFCHRLRQLSCQKSCPHNVLHSVPSVVPGEHLAVEEAVVRLCSFLLVRSADLRTENHLESDLSKTNMDKHWQYGFLWWVYKVWTWYDDQV